MRSFEEDDNPEIIKTKKPMPIQAGTLTIASDEQVFYFYLEESASVRKKYGIAKKGKNGFEKYFIEDLKLIEALDPVRKEWLRQWVKDKQRTGKWGKNEDS